MKLESHFVVNYPSSTNSHRELKDPWVPSTKGTQPSLGPLTSRVKRVPGEPNPPLGPPTLNPNTTSLHHKFTRPLGLISYLSFAYSNLACELTTINLSFPY